MISKEEAKLNYIVTSNLNLVSFLCSKGFVYDEMSRFKDSAMFYFKKSIELDNTINEFFNNAELRNYLSFVRKIRNEVKLIR